MPMMQAMMDTSVMVALLLVAPALGGEEGGGGDGDGEVEGLIDGFVHVVAVDQVMGGGVDGDEEGAGVPTDVGGAGADGLDERDDGDVAGTVAPAVIFVLGLGPGLAAPVGAE